MWYNDEGGVILVGGLFLIALYAIWTLWLKRWHPDAKVGWFPNQFVFGVMVDYGAIIPVRWIVILLGPITLSIAAGRRGS